MTFLSCVFFKTMVSYNIISFLNGVSLFYLFTFNPFLCASLLSCVGLKTIETIETIFSLP